MAELSTLARPYAKAVFEFAVEANDLNGWSQQLATTAAVARTETMKKALGSPSLTSEQQADRFIQVCGNELTGKGHNFVKTLAENKRLLLLPEIFALFEEFKANRERSVDVEVATAFALKGAQEKKLAQALGKKLERDVNVKTVVDKTLIGGVLVRAADIVIDGSVRGRLTKLAELMNS